MDNAYNLYNLEAKRLAPRIRQLAETRGGEVMKSHKVGQDLFSLKRNWQAYRPSIAKASFKMFWLSLAITISFIISNLYLFFSR